MSALPHKNTSALAFDHLVLAAATLDDGVAWCERMLGIRPGPGGKHALMGTHNRVFSLACDAFPRAYFELIAIDPEAPPPGRARWFGLDDAALRAALAHGPRLVHWVARTPDLDATLAALSVRGIDAGRPMQASRATPRGPLHWRFAVPDDGLPLFGGALPMPIEWGATHPADALPASGVTLGSLTLGVAEHAVLREALEELGLGAMAATGPALTAVLDTPRGRVTLSTSP